LKETPRRRNIAKRQLLGQVRKKMAAKDAQLIMIIEKGSFTLESSLFPLVVNSRKGFRGAFFGH
jgi:hypothetical protein